MLSPETQNTDISKGSYLRLATGHQRLRARICDWTSKVKGSYLRLNIKGPESMPDGMGHGTQRHNTTATLIQTTCNSAGGRCGMFHDPV